MIVKNVISIIFIFVSVTAFARCAVTARKHHLTLKKEIGYQPESNDVLPRSLGNFGVMRRSLNPMMFEQFSSNSIRYLNDEHNFSNVDNEKNIVIEKLKLSVIFRDNVLYVFSYLLHGRENGLTEEQYASLQIIYDFIKKKMIYMYNLLPVLSKLKDMDINQQTIIILTSLAKNLPFYIHCTAEYLANEIELKRIDLDILLKPTASETFNYLNNIDLHIIGGKIKNDEMKGHNKYSNITQKALGSVFVKLLYDLQTKKLSLSQELFGLILINLPNPSNDPVLEENIRFLYDLTKNNAIDRKNWDFIKKDHIGNDAYTLVFSILTKILNSNVPITIKDAAVYVYHHLKIITIPTYVNSNLKYMYHLTENDINIGMLFSAIIPQNFGPDAIRMKNNLLNYFMQNYNNDNMNRIFKDFNKFAYSDSLDLLLAFLTRLINRIPTLPNTNSRAIHQSATALLPSLIMEKHSRISTLFVSPEIDVLILLESLKTPDTDLVLQSTIDSIKMELIEQPEISVLLSTLIPTEKEKCLIPKECLLNTFHQIHTLQNNIPLSLITKIQNLMYIVKTTSYQPKIIPTQHSINPIDVNLYINREKPVAVAIETDAYTNNNMLSNFKGIPFVWNIDKYVSKVGPVVEKEVDAETSIKWISGIPTYVESEEAKIVYETHPTIDKVPETHVTEAHLEKTKFTKTKVIEAKPETIKPTVISSEITKIGIAESQEITLDQSSTMKPSLTTSMFNISSITHTPTQNSKKKHSTASTIKSQTVKAYNIKTEDVSEHIPSVTFHEDELTSSISEEIEDEIFSAKEVSIEVSKEVIKPIKTIRAHKSKITQRTKEQVNNENVSNAIVLPPSIETDQPLKIQVSNSGVLVVMTGDHYETTESEIILPEIKELLKPPEINNLLHDSDSPIVTQVLRPLSVIFGKNYVKKILKNVDTKTYSTTIALLSAVLKEAISYPEVTKNTHLTNVIYKYISTIKYVSPTILLPIVVSSKKLVSHVIYSTFNPNDLTHSRIEENPPTEILSDSVTVPLVNPKILLQSINPLSPYVDLLPTLEEDNKFAKIIKPLKMILTSEKILEILGPDFQPLVYPNKGALLVTLLHKLQESHIIQSNPKLKYLINIYIQAIEVPSMNIQVSEDKLVKMMSETTGQWQPELTSLISALPKAKNNEEVTMISELELFLSDPGLLKKLQIERPPLTMSRGELLHKIILTALSKLQLEKRLLKVLKYYKDKVEHNEMGALPIMWMWVETYVFKAEVQLGNMIQETINFKELSYEHKLAYNDLVTYLAKNPDLLQDNEDFDFEKYKTQGQFIKGLFKHLLKKPQVNAKIKKNIQIILPNVMLSGAGAIPMPSFDEI